MNAYTEHYFPLECNLDVVTELVRRLGADEDLAFEKALSLDKPELFPRPALAVVLALPTAPAHGERKAVAEATRGEYTGGDEKAVLWFKQRINDACGWYAVLRALCSSAHDFLGE